jgi:hypothetical protein
MPTKRPQEGAPKEVLSRNLDHKKLYPNTTNYLLHSRTYLQKTPSENYPSPNQNWMMERDTAEGQLRGRG